MDKLKHCPFCGSKFNLFGSVLGNCEHERCILNTVIINKDKWNHRPIEDKLQAELEAVKAENEHLTNLLEDVVNELDLSDVAIEKHGQAGTPPSELVKLVLEEKDFNYVFTQWIT